MSHLVHFQGGSPSAIPNSLSVTCEIQLALRVSSAPLRNNAGISASDTKAARVPLGPAIPTVISAANRASPRRQIGRNRNISRNIGHDISRNISLPNRNIRRNRHISRVTEFKTCARRIRLFPRASYDSPAT